MAKKSLIQREHKRKKLEEKYRLIRQSFLFGLWNHFVLFFIMFCSFWFEPRSTQHRSLKGSSTTHQSTKARIFQKVDSFSRVHNRMDKLTLTRQFWIQLGIFLGRYREEIEME